MGLMDSLSMAARSLQAQQYAMDVTGQNITNVNTPGYARRVVDFVSVPPKSGGGVEVQAVHGLRDMLLERRVTNEAPIASRESAIADALGVIESTLGKPGDSIDGELSAFFDQFAALADDVTSPVARNQVQVAGQSLAAAFNDMASRFETARRDADTRVRSTVQQINDLTSKIASLNTQIGNSPNDTTGLTLRDQQSGLVRQLSELINVQVIERERGGVDITFGNGGHPLVIADNQYALAAASTAPGGYAALTSNGTTVTSDVTGGTLGGLLHARDAAIPSYQNALDQLAADTMQQVNALHTAGFDRNGNPGVNFFTYNGTVTGVAGAAAALQVNPTIAADNSRIAAASVAQVGDNGAAKAIAALRTQRVLNGGTATLIDSWSTLVYQVGADSQSAAQSRDAHADIIREVDALRDQVSGVSLDEEALNMLKFQRAYEANARFFTTVDSMLNTLINGMLR